MNRRRTRSVAAICLMSAAALLVVRAEVQPAQGQASGSSSAGSSAQNPPSGHPALLPAQTRNAVAGELSPKQPEPITLATRLHYSIQGGPSPQQAVSYASVTQLNGLLSQLETASKSTQDDLGNLRIERWKTDATYKKQSLANVESIQRNLKDALPAIISQLKSSPEDLPSTFKLYRNLDALYDVLGNVVESAGAFGSKDDFQTLSNDLNSFEGTRKQFAERIENLSSSKEAEIVRLRTDLKSAQASVPAEPPKKIVVDDTAPAKKPAAKKKPAPKPGTTSKPTGSPGSSNAPAKPAAGQAQTQPAQTQPNQAQPQTKPQ